jgi:uncharacterized protein YecT (DUF1311 family)
MKKLIIVSTILLTSLVLPVLAGEKKCEISCNPEYRKADDQLNQTWQGLTKTERQILRPSQRQWIKDRDKTCGKNDSCLTNETKKQTDQLRRVNQCVKGQGGLSCFDRSK